MNTLEFFNRILPQQGFVVIAEYVPGGGFRHAFCDTHDLAARVALKLDSQGKTVYHACATFKTKASRKQDNAGWMKSFWVDADVDPSDPQKYPDLKTALIDIGRVCRELTLPLPLIVKSGRGAHAYWTLDSDVEAQRWTHIAVLFKAKLDSLGFRQDRTRTADSSSVLRPVGTHWRKDGEKRVQSISLGTPIAFGEFVSRLGANDLDCIGERDSPLRGGSTGADINDELTGGPVEYPPSSADEIIKHCATLAHCAAKRGDITEPLWRAMLGVVKYTTEGDQRAHEWSAGHPDYSEVETQEKLDRWQKGPTTCDHFRGTNGNACRGCKQNVTSPILLGYTADAPAPMVATPMVAEISSEPVEIPHWPKRSFFWNGTQLCRSLKDEAGQVNWVPFCETLFYPTERVRQEDGTWAMRISYVKRANQRGEFDMPMSLLGELNKLNAHFAAQEIILMGPQGKASGQELLRQYNLSLQQLGSGQRTYSHCGWAESNTGFLVGNRRISATGDIEVLGNEIMQAARWAVDLGKEGTKERWVELIDFIYNRPGAEPFQFVIGAGFAAPLVELVNSDNWHGIPIALTGPGGVGKTTTARIACGIYGDGKLFVTNASTSGSTMNAILMRMGVACNLPVVFDELSNRTVEEICDFLYALSNGRPKDRLRADGKPIDLKLSWNTISFITANICVTEFLNTLARNVTDATQVRCFEIPLSAEANQIWKGEPVVDLLEHQLGDQHGVVGREVWLPYVIANQVTLRDEIRALRAKFNQNSAEENKERYFRDLIVSVVVALKHAKKLGLVNFEIPAVLKWAKEHILTLRRMRSDNRYTPEDTVAHFLTSLYGRILITDQFRDGRTVVEAPKDQMRGTPLARMALKDRIFLVTVKAINDWCTENKVQASWLMDEMDKNAYTMHRPGSNRHGVRKERITRGTNLPGLPVSVIELDYAKVFGLVTVIQDNVVQLKEQPHESKGK